MQTTTELWSVGLYFKICLISDEILCVVELIGSSA